MPEHRVDVAGGMDDLDDFNAVGLHAVEDYERPDDECPKTPGKVIASLAEKWLPGKKSEPLKENFDLAGRGDGTVVFDADVVPNLVQVGTDARIKGEAAHGAPGSLVSPAASYRRRPRA